MRIAMWMSACVLVVAAAGAPAKENYQEKAFNADSKDKFAQVEEQIRDQMKAGGKYEYVKDNERETIDRKFKEMDGLFATSDTVAGMSEQNKIALFNAQETVNSILQQRDRDRVICKKEAPIGSHILTTNCHTYAQEQDANKLSHKQMDSWSRTTCSDNSGGVCGMSNGSSGGMLGTKPGSGH